MDVFNALKISFVSLDRSECAIKKDDGEDYLQGGAVANISLKINNKLWNANLGDCRALLIDPETGETEQLSEDAILRGSGCELFIRSVKKRGGYVCGGRINGSLEPARAFGDHGYKGGVSARPKETRYTQDEWSGKILFQSCDGVTDVLPTERLGQLVGRYYNGYPAITAARIVAEAYREGSTNNMTCIITPLGEQPPRGDFKDDGTTDLSFLH